MKLQELEKTVREIMPEACGVTSVSPEGLSIVIYIRKIRVFYENDQLIKKLAGALRKKVLVRVDPSMLSPVEKAKEYIKNLVPNEAGVKEIYFCPEFSEVYIEAFKPGLVIGKNGVNLKSIMINTGWSPKVWRAPVMPSATLEGVRKNMVFEASERKKVLQKIGKDILQNGTSPTEWVRAVCLGGFYEVGRSCMLIQTNNSKILIECGVNPVSTDPPKAYPYLNMLGFPISSLDAVIITHSHIDHMGFLPYLFEYGYNGPVYCTQPTRDLMLLLQQDYLNITKMFNSQTPYSKKAIQKQLRNIITLNYGEVADIAPDMKLTFYNAGHILGSAMAHLHIGDGAHNVVFSGDIKFGFTQLFDPAHTAFPRAETLFVESTYGSKQDVIGKRKDAEAKLVKIIEKTIARKGSVLIPVFAVGRSQEAMITLESYFKNSKLDFPIYTDGMVLEASAIHTAYPEYLRKGLQRKILSGNNPFEWERFRVVKGMSRDEVVNGEPCVILAPSGMLNGGPSYEYFRMMCEEPKNSIIFIGYQSPLSLGSKVQRGVKEVPLIDDDGRTVSKQVEMEVHTVEGFSGHSDRAQLMAFVRNFSPRPKQIFTMHGNPTKTEEFSRDIMRAYKIPARPLKDLEAVRLL